MSNISNNVLFFNNYYTLASFLIIVKIELLSLHQFTIDDLSNVPRVGKIYRRHRISLNGLNILCQYFCLREKKLGQDRTRFDACSLTWITDKSYFTANCIESRWMSTSWDREKPGNKREKSKIAQKGRRGSLWYSVLTTRFHKKSFHYVPALIHARVAQNRDVTETNEGPRRILFHSEQASA